MINMSKHIKTKVLYLLFFLSAGSLAGQKTVVDDQQLWTAVFSQIRLTDKWGIWFDAHLRFKEDFVGDLSQGIIRLGPTYYVNDNVRLTAAYAYVHTFPAPGHANIGLPEHRPWQQVMWLTPGKNIRLAQSIRLEERYRRKTLDDDHLGEGYNFNWRARLNFTVSLPLTKKKFEPGGLQAVINEELMVNFGKNVVYNHFDQNRFFVGLAYPFSKHAQIQAGYMNLYQQLASGNQFRNQHTIRIFYFHNIDLRE